ncbi:NACHT and WD40 repeat domain-containing protein [Pseudoalteromonas rubra]|nr:pentapeptide repeat-containing protein [Pseudoalteromonas rubra]
MSPDQFDSKLQYIRHIVTHHSDEFSTTLTSFLHQLLDFAKETQSFQLEKSKLTESIEAASGSLSSANFRKRVSQLNDILADEDVQAGVWLSNSKSVLSFEFNDDVLSQFVDKQTVDTIRRVNESGAPNTAHLVESTASDVMAGTSPQVMFSYCRGGKKSVLERKREFADLLKGALKHPPADYKTDPKIRLFVDTSGFEVGEDQVAQQDLACEQSAAVVVPYCDSYLYSEPCQRELSFFLSEEGKNHTGKKAIITPFSTVEEEADSRYRNNLVAVPGQHATVLELLESGTDTEIQSYISGLVHALYRHFRKLHTRPPASSEHDIVRTCLMDAAKQQQTLPNTEDPLAAQGSQISHEYGIKIVPYLQEWALSSAPDTTRLFYLLGDFGAGKSTTCQLLANNLTAEYDQAKQRGEAVLPIYLDLKKLLNAFNDVSDSLNAPVEKLLETMLSITGASQVAGEKIIEFVHKHPTVLIFDGFDEVGQKLNDKQQIGLLNKIVGIFPDTVYQQDLQRLQDKPLEQPSQIPLRSRILITCRTHFFSSMEKESAFRHLYYRHDAGEKAGDTTNFQTYYLLPFSKEQIQSYLVKWLGEEEGHKAVEFIERVHDLSGLSERPVMLQFIRQLIPDLMREAEHNPNINAATLYKKLFERAMTRDIEKHWIDTQEKFQLLSRFAVYMWQQKTTELNQQLLVEWFKQHYSQFTQIQVDIQQGRAGISELLQDLFNACLLVRDQQDNYRFAHTSFFEFFLACGLFDLVRTAPPQWQQGFDIFTGELAAGFAAQDQILNRETQQFLIDWRLTANPHYQRQFDRQWQTLQQQACTQHNKQLAFDLWYFAYQSEQDFVQVIRPDWSGVKLQKVDFIHSLDLSGANFSDCLISQSLWRDINLSGCQFSGARLMQCHFAHCMFGSPQSVPASLQFSRFWQCRDVAQICADTYPEQRFNLVMPSPQVDLDSGLRLGLPPSRSDWPVIRFSPDGKSLAFGAKEGGVCIQVIESGVVHQVVQTQGEVESLSYSPNGHWLAFAAAGKVCLLDLEREQIQDVAQADSGAQAMNFSPDSRSLVFSNRGTVNELDINSGKVRELAKAEGRILTLSYNPDGDTLAYAGCDNKVWLHSIETGVEREVAQAYDWIRDLSYRPDGCELAFLSDDGMVNILNTVNGAVDEAVQPREWTSCLNYHPDGRLLTYGGALGVHTLDIEHADISNIVSAEREVVDLSYSPDGSQLALAGIDGNTSLLDISTNEYRDLIQQLISVQSHSYSPDGRFLAFGGSDGWVRIVNLATGEIEVVECIGEVITLLTYDADGCSLAIVGNYGVIYIMELARGKARKVTLIEERIKSLHFSPDGSSLICADHFGTLTKLECVTGIKNEIVEIDHVWKLSLSPDGYSLAFADHDDQISIVNLVSGQVLELGKVNVDTMSLCFWPDGCSLVLGDDDGGIWLLDIASGEVSELAQVCEPVLNLCFNPDGSALIYRGKSGKIKSLEIASGKVQEVTQAHGGILNYSPDGLFLTLQGAGGGLKLLHKDYQLDIRVCEDSYFIFADNQLIKTGGESWRYLTGVNPQENRYCEFIDPTSHPDWADLAKPYNLLTNTRL